MRRNRAVLESLLGPESWRGETRWFSTGAEPQVDVIRWIKQCLEDPGVRAAFMVDPYLGSEALGRIVIRHGNETMSLSIVVSPADVDPDAAELDAKGDPDRHVLILRAAAEEFANQLCGAVSIIHVRRGQGRRQAFHDRYFGHIGQDGVPRVYLLSNSLNKAAGDWPFAVVEFDRVDSWKIFAYVRGLVSGSDRGRALIVDEVWPGTAKPKDARSASGSTSSARCWWPTMSATRCGA